MPVGNLVEECLLNYLIGLQEPVHRLLIDRDKNYELQALIPFSSDRKRMTVAYRLPDSKVVRLVVKGAPEEVLPRCDKQLDLDLNSVSFN